MLNLLKGHGLSNYFVKSYRLSGGMEKSDNYLKGIGFAFIPFEWNKSADGG
jgi:hypothetical protein